MYGEAAARSGELVHAIRGVLAHGCKRTGSMRHDDTSQGVMCDENL